MKTYIFANGDRMTSKLDSEELMKRLRRLDLLRVMTEQHDCPEGNNICKKALNAYNRMDNFTGIIRLSFLEKDWLGYFLEDSCITEEEIEVIKFYCK